MEGEQMKWRRRVEHTEVWEELEECLLWPEQREYEIIRPVVVFGDSVAERAVETGISERTIYRKSSAFEDGGVPTLFATEPAKRQVLPPAIRRMILDLKAEHPPLNNNEISNICYVRFGRRPDRHTVERILAEEPMQLKTHRRFEPYHRIPEARERRKAVVTLHHEGWAAKSIAGYLKTHKSTVHRVLNRWYEEGPAGLEDKPRGRPRGVQKVDLRAVLAIKKIQENPELGAFRVKAELEEAGIYLGVRTVGRVMAMNRETYGLKKPKRSPHQKRQMPFQTHIRHRYWTVDVRYITDHRLPPEEVESYVYVISMLDNASRCVLASSISTRQNESAYLSVLYTAVERHGSPVAIVSDGAPVFRSKQSKAVYEALGIEKEQIEAGQPWQSFIETMFSIQKRMADFHFAKAESWEELVEAHAEWVKKYNTQSHWAHKDRKDGRRSPAEVLGWVPGRWHSPEVLQRAFFATRFMRVLDASGYAKLMHWRIYAEEGLARCEVALWLGSDDLTVEYEGEALSRYEVDYQPDAGRIREVKSSMLFATRHYSLQPRLFGLDDALGETGWLKALKLDEYAPRRLRRSQNLQQLLFAYGEVL
jgi:putative transposase